MNLPMDHGEREKQLRKLKLLARLNKVEKRLDTLEKILAARDEQGTLLHEISACILEYKH